jgi:hypothetical protein
VADSPQDAVNAFIEEVNSIGLRNFYFFVEDESGQTWVVNTSDHSPVLETLEEWDERQRALGLEAPPPDNDGDDEDDDTDEPQPQRPTKATSPARRPTRTRSSARATKPTEPAPIPNDAREAVQQQLARRRGKDSPGTP